MCLPKGYDDGGFSGATMDRPALQQLLADLTAGRVDIVVVYKIDRLTRSLADFAKIVEILDARGASFVSVTQQFNTTTSMGRLTLNVLLSFAQFEREVIGERIRRPGGNPGVRILLPMWWGGTGDPGEDPAESLGFSSQRARRDVTLKGVVRRNRQDGTGTAPCGGQPSVGLHGLLSSTARKTGAVRRLRLLPYSCV